MTQSTIAALAEHTGAPGAALVLVGLACVIFGLGTAVGSITRRSPGQFWIGVAFAAAGVGAVFYALYAPAGR